MNDWDDAEAPVRAGTGAVRQRRWNEALAELRAATDINPYNAAWHVNIGLTLDELPLSIGVLRARDLRAQGVDSLSEAIRREPAASDAYNTVGYVESIQLRGFLLEGFLNYRRNGLPVSPFTPFTLVTKQQIEIMKGLNGAVTGIGNPAGTVNFVPKRATVDVNELSLDAGERGSWLAAADYGRRVSDGFGYRFNVAHGQRRRPRAMPTAKAAWWPARSTGAARADWRSKPSSRCRTRARSACRASACSMATVTAWPRRSRRPRCWARASTSTTSRGRSRSTAARRSAPPRRRCRWRRTGR